MPKTDSNKPEAVLDASALLAHIDDEPGAEAVGEAIVNGAAISIVNWIEVLSKLAERGEDPEIASAEMTTPGLVETAVTIELVTAEDAIEAARLRPLTKERGLSLADRACLALGTRLEVPVLTADREWDDLRNDRAIVKLIR
ncbi:MAG TPA: type II toxin-antitoxin system VapC family toxin [Solirubrobacterales bacterium]